jgi:hypothetical protein
LTTTSDFRESAGIVDLGTTGIGNFLTRMTIKMSSKSVPVTRVLSSSGNSASASDDDLPSIFRPTGTNSVPADCSIDQLLKSRQNEIARVPGIRRLLESPELSDDEPEIPQFQDPIDLTPTLSRDASIFDFTESCFQTSVLELIHPPSNYERPACPRLPSWQLKTVELYPDQAPHSASILLSLLQEVFITRSRPLRHTIVNYARSLPRHSVSFSIWISLVVESINADPMRLICLLAIAAFDLFQYESDPDIAYRDIIVLYFAAILCPQVSTRSTFHLAVRQLRDNLTSEVLTDDAISNLISDCSELVFDAATENISLLLSVFPLDGKGAQIMFAIGGRLALNLLGAEPPSRPTFEEFTVVLADIKKLIQSSDDADLMKFGVVLALTEKIVVAGMRLKVVNRRGLEQIAKDLKFSFASSDAGEMTTLKEQVHVTRMQIEMLLQSVAIPD